jgi:hypothetical protein
MSITKQTCCIWRRYWLSWALRFCCWCTLIQSNTATRCSSSSAWASICEPHESPRQSISHYSTSMEVVRNTSKTSTATKSNNKQQRRRLQQHCAITIETNKAFWVTLLRHVCVCVCVCMCVSLHSAAVELPDAHVPGSIVGSGFNESCCISWFGQNYYLTSNSLPMMMIMIMIMSATTL